MCCERLRIRSFVNWVTCKQGASPRSPNARISLISPRLNPTVLAALMKHSRPGAPLRQPEGIAPEKTAEYGIKVVSAVVVDGTLDQSAQRLSARPSKV
jgi:hypothetical protein